MAKGTNRGHHKVETKKAQNEEQSHGVFAQRREELFKLANEMCILTGAQVALIVVSSASNKVFSFGCPNVQFVINKYQNQSGLYHVGGHPAPERSPPKTNQERLDKELLRMEEKVENEKKRGKILDQMIKARKGKHGWDAPIEKLELDQLEGLLKANQAIYDDISKQLRKISTPTQAPPASMDNFPNASIPYLVNRISSLNAGEGSSNAMSSFDGIMQSGGSSRTNFGAPEEMIASTSGSNPIDSKGTKKKN